jgi:hypothetical protein
MFGAVASSTPALAADPPIIRFYTTAYGSPSPVAPGETITWWFQGIDSTDGNAELSDISWSSRLCGTSSFPGLYEPGDTTPLVSCTSTAPASGVATNLTTFHATVTATGEQLVVDVTPSVAVVAPLTSVLTGHATASAAAFAQGDAITWSISATNDGTATLDDVAWTSTKCGVGPPAVTLAPGVTTPTQTCTSTAPATGTVDNQATFAATTDGTGTAVEATSTATVTVQPAVNSPPSNPSSPQAVAPTVPDGDGQLARTGADPIAPANSAALLIAIGIVAVTAARRRRRKGGVSSS